MTAPVVTLDSLPDVLTAEEARALLRVSRNAFYRSVARGDIPVIRLGRSQRFSKAALARLMEGE